MCTSLLKLGLFDGRLNLELCIIWPGWVDNEEAF